MKFQLILENQNGDQINMTTTANQYMISEIDGLYPPAGTISTATYAGMDGSYLNNAFIEKRNIVISFKMRGTGLETRRHLLYKVVKPSRYIKVYYKTRSVDVYTEGIVETCEIQNFGGLVSGQISILCPDPYWYSTSAEVAYYSKIVGGFTFPFSVDSSGVPLGTYSTTDNVSLINSGDVTGFTIQIEAFDNAMTPTIYNADTGAYLRINGEVLKGDIITITTKTGNKTITLNRNGVDSNIINSLVSGSTWLQLSEGKNTFHIEAVRNCKNLKVIFFHTNAYLGV